jgi:hypothetical protein
MSYIVYLAIGLATFALLLALTHAVARGERE